MSDSFTIEFLVRNAEGALVPLAGVAVRSVVAHEAIGTLPRLDVELVCAAERELSKELIPGTQVALHFLPAEAPPSLDPNAPSFEARGGRRFHGVVYRFEASLSAPPSSVTAFRAYRLEIGSRFSDTHLVSSHAVFVDQSIREIAEAKLKAFGFAASDDLEATDYVLQFEADARDGLPKRPLTIQYGESDSDFLRRLFEREGLSVFVEHGGSRDRLVVTDIPQRFRVCESAPEARFRGRGEVLDVYELEETRSFAPNAYVVRGYDERNPNEPYASVDERSGESRAGGVYEYGAADDAAHAERLARIRAEECEVRQVQYSGKSTYGGFAAGTRTTLVDHPAFPAPQGLPLLLTRLTHFASIPTPWESERVAEYHNEFVAIPGERRFRPPLTKPLPRMPNVTTAVVQGPQAADRNGYDAVLDGRGQYRIAFHFDTEPRALSSRSCPVRMAQPLAGSTEGMHFPLRPGTEVLVSFIDGHPDRPVIVGALPNVTTPSPVTAANPNEHVLRSPGGATIAFGRPA